MTKRQQVGSSWAESSWAEKLQRAGITAAAIGTIAALAMAASGCDTVARISFSERSFTDIHAAGFSPPTSSVGNPNACKGVTTDGGDMRVRFVLSDNDGKPIRLGEAVDNLDVQLTKDSVEFTDSALMQVSRSATCDPDQCASGFGCGKAPGIDDASLEACVNPDASFAVSSASDAVEFIADNNEHQVYGLLMEQTGSLYGWNPPGSNGAWDKNGDGDTSDEDDAVPHPGGPVGETIATDWRNSRLGAVLKTQTPWTTAALLAQGEKRETFYGLWTFNEDKVAPVSQVAETTNTDEQWTKDGGTVRNTVTTYNAVTEPRGPRANVYESIENVINDQYSTSAMEALNLQRADSVDKQLVVFVDGYDDMRETDDATIDGVIEAATTQNVRVFVVHLDPKLQEPDTLRDDPMYPSKQQPCSDDSECKNFEACTKPRGYSERKGEPIEVPTGAAYDLDQTYCIPKRDDFGRTGPINDYARLACATGGGYMYVPTANAVDENLSWTPLALDGLWEAKLASGTIDRGNAPAQSPLRIHSQMGVTVAGEKRTYHFSQVGNLSTGSDSSSDDFDNRGVVFTAD